MFAAPMFAQAEFGQPDEQPIPVDFHFGGLAAVMVVLEFLRR